MTGQESVREGMPVYGPGDEPLGTVTHMHGDGFDLSWQRSAGLTVHPSRRRAPSLGIDI